MSESYTIKQFVGKFKIRDDFGNIRAYNEGDVVTYEGSQYIASKLTSGFSPLHGSRAGWVKMESEGTMTFINSESEPEIANEGDHWFDSTNGKLFIYLKDKDTTQWVEL